MIECASRVQKPASPLARCLGALDSCRPHVLAFLGERRGWVPSLADIDHECLVRYPALRDAVVAEPERRIAARRQHGAQRVANALARLGGRLAGLVVDHADVCEAVAGRRHFDDRVEDYVLRPGASPAP